MAEEQDAERIALSLPETTKDPDDFRFFVKGKQFPWSYLERVEPKEPRVRRNEFLLFALRTRMRKRFCSRPIPPPSSRPLTTMGTPRFRRDFRKTRPMSSKHC